MVTQLTVRMPEDLRKALDRASRKLNRKPSELVRMALREFLRVDSGITSRPADRVRGLLGSLDSGVPDLAERHREYILESLNVPNELLLDTGALVSMLDRAQKDHGGFVDFFDSWDGPVFSSEAVLTEATHLLGRVPGGSKACLDFFLAGGAVLVPLTPSSIRRCRELVEQYENLPMDFADATLVVLAEDLGTDLVFTTDRRDFGIYRIRGKRPFRIKP